MFNGPTELYNHISCKCLGLVMPSHDSRMASHMGNGERRPGKRAQKVQTQPVNSTEVRCTWSTFVHTINKHWELGENELAQIA